MQQLDLLSWRDTPKPTPEKLEAQKADGRRSRAARRSTQSIREIERQDARARRQPGHQELPTSYWRPKTRGDCAKVPRPCPYVGCRYNMALDVTSHGSLRYTHVDPDGTLGPAPNCALDYAERGPMTLEAIANTMNLTRERVRQEEVATMARARNIKLFDLEGTRVQAHNFNFEADC